MASDAEVWPCTLLISSAEPESVKYKVQLKGPRAHISARQCSKFFCQMRGVRDVCRQHRNIGRLLMNKCVLKDVFMAVRLICTRQRMAGYNMEASLAPWTYE